MYDGEGEVVWIAYLQDFYAFIDDADDFFDEEVRLLLSHTLRESPQRWCHNLHLSSVHSLDQFYDLIEYNFHHFDMKPLDKTMLKQRNTPQESPTDFW